MADDGRLRLKGQDCSLTLTDPDGPVASLVKLVEFSIVLLAEILQEDYCDTDAPEFDEIPNGVELKAKFHHNDPDVFDFFKKVNDRRARISDPLGKFSAMTRCNFPGQGRRRIVVPNLFFGDLPFTAGGRKQFTATEINGKASRAKFIRG